MGPAPTVIFLHIGKTGGSTLRTVIHRNVPRSRRLLVRIPQLRDTLRPRRERTVEHFASLPEARRAGADLIEGHVIYGIHRHVPGPSTYITILRDPVALVVSQYRYVLRTPTHRLHDQVASSGLDLEAYVRSGLSLETDNSQTRAISGDTTTPFGACTQAMLDTALSNIRERFSVVGLTERFDETLILLGRAFGWRRLAYVPVKVAPGRREPVPERTRELIREQNRFDEELYRACAQRLDEELAGVPDLGRELARLRGRNRRYAPWGRLTHSAAGPLRARLRGRSPAVATSDDED